MLMIVVYSMCCLGDNLITISSQNANLNAIQ